MSRFAGKRVHFIGIGGAGMSGLARMLLDRGAVVTGSEPVPNEQTRRLAESGARITREQLGQLLCPDVHLVVRTAAVPDSNVELQIATRLGLKTVKYAQLLGEVMNEQVGVAVAGTHGKSTTTAMIAHALLVCGMDPSFVIGGTVPQLGGSARSGAGRVFVAEACEYDRSFHCLRPSIAVITNIDTDHLDCYRDLEEIIAAFRRFARLVPPAGTIIAAAEDHVAAALHVLDTPIQWCALETPADWTTRSLGVQEGCHSGLILRQGEPVATLRLSIPGRHNLSNATLAVAACCACGLDPQQAADAISSFAGVDRRMTEIGRAGGVIVVDDYAHHPTEIRSTLEALREKYCPNRLICIFQPHQASRTRLLMDEFAASFARADLTILPEIYYVRDSEEDRRSVSSAELARRINRNGSSAVFCPSFAEVIEHLRPVLRGGDLVVTMGAGNVWEIGRQILSECEMRIAG
ncbi:MAG: UDP-N-acetylmuramate--L-alanine ligase [Phycisphaerae bacterium]|nr:UDP-N-acetylmuramate--L-alanine ligase [Phycisphaerae bacterium]MDW8262771.1 UDP-N-acetylmuramate--L-alanine ligase [Phycisphaerales bacterium]